MDSQQRRQNRLTAPHDGLREPHLTQLLNQPWSEFSLGLNDGALLKLVIEMELAHFQHRHLDLTR